MWLILGFCLLSLSLCYVTLSTGFLYWEKRKIPHPPFSILFGNLKDVVLMKKSIGQVYHEIYNQFPSLPYVGFYKMQKPSILLRDPELIKNVLTTHFDSFANNDFDVDTLNDPLIAKNPFFSSGEQWKINRSQILPAFTEKQIRNNFLCMQLACHKLNKFLANSHIANGGIEIREMCEKFVMEVIASCSIGLEANSFESQDSNFIKAARKIISPDFFTNLRVMFKFLVPSLARSLKVRFIPKSSGSYFKNIIERTTQYRKDNEIVYNDFLNTMLEQQMEVGEENLSNTDITGHALSFLIDGFESTSIAISFVLYELGANVNLQEKIRLEIENKIGKMQRKIDYEFVHELNFLHNFINETLRLFPPTMYFAKTCTKKFQLPPLAPNKHPLVVEQHTAIAIPVYSIQRDSKYFADPDVFNPERFNDKNIEKAVFLPFGSGPRACPAQGFAMAQIKVAIINLILNFDIRVNNKTIIPIQLDPKYFFAIAKGGLWLNFIRRKNDH